MKVRYEIVNINHGIKRYMIKEKFDEVEYLKEVSENTNKKKVAIKTYLRTLKYLMLFFEDMIKKQHKIAIIGI